MNKDLGKYFGSLMMFSFGVIALFRWHQTGLIFFLLLVLRDFAAAYFFLKRKPATVIASRTMTILSYVSAAIPLLYFSSNMSNRTLLLGADLLAVIGFLFVALATIELGASIGISPAKREYVSTGIYRWVKHPMYLGYVLSEIGLSLINPFNIGLNLVSFTLYCLRAHKEKEILMVDRDKI